MMRIILCATVLFALLPLGAAPSWAEGVIKDAESATHGYDAAIHTVEQTLDLPGVRIVQFNLSVLSHYSYLVVSNGEALMVDPSRDIQAYLDYAAKENIAIKGVFLTHSHADFIAGHMEFAAALKCPIHASAASGAKYPHEAMKEGSEIPVGTSVVRILETPGHTPDGLCGVVYGKPEDPAPVALLSGDTLFIGSVGRPDLLEGKMTAAVLAGMCFDSWTTKLANLPDATIILPAHGAGSLCGAHLSDKPSATIGEERVANPYLSIKGKSDFVMAVLRDLTEPPQYFGHNARINREGPEVVKWDAPLPAPVKARESVSAPANGYVVDIRIPEEYAAGHIPNAINIGLRGRFETWTGIMIPWGAKLILTGSEAELKESLPRLRRIGYEPSILPMDAWIAANLPVRQSGRVAPADLFGQMKEGTQPIIVDVRLPNEWMGVRIGDVLNLPLNHLAELSSKLDPTLPVVAVCNSAYRSSMAAGVLERAGFTQPASLDGGSEAWINAGLPVFGADSGAHATLPAPAPTPAPVPVAEPTPAAEPAPVVAPPASPQPEPTTLKLAERISPVELQRLMADLPGTFELVDIRPAEAFADYSLPGARNVNIEELFTNAAFLDGAGSLIIIDRDGSLAMMAAGILSQKTKRNIRALHGGLTAWWEEMERGKAIREVPISAAPAPSAVPAPPSAPASIEAPAVKAPAAPEAAPATPVKPKTKSAGC